MSAACSHESARVTRTHGFSGAVSRDENHMAHGCVCMTYECSACGARREVNVNGQHRENGAWGPSRAERIARARAAVDRAHLPAALVCGDLRAEVDAAGYILITGAHEDGIERTLPASWIAAAQRRRRAVAALESEVQS